MKQHKPCLPQEGYVRLAQILGPEGPIPIGKSSWWAGVKNGRYPRPLKIGPRITVWRVEDIRELIAVTAGRAVERSNCIKEEGALDRKPPPH